MLKKNSSRIFFFVIKWQPFYVHIYSDNSGGAEHFPLLIILLWGLFDNLFFLSLNFFRTNRPLVDKGIM